MAKLVRINKGSIAGNTIEGIRGADPTSSTYKKHNIEDNLTRVFQETGLKPNYQYGIDIFGNPIAMLQIEKAVLDNCSIETVQVEVRANPFRPTEQGHIASYRSYRAGVTEAKERLRKQEAIDFPEGCFPDKADEHSKCFFHSKNVLNDPTRLRALPGMVLEISDFLGDQEQFELNQIIMLGNFNPSDVNQYMFLSTVDHHKRICTRPLEQVIELLQFTHYLTELAISRNEYDSLEIIKNRGELAGGTVKHPHWQVRAVKHLPPKLSDLVNLSYAGDAVKWVVEKEVGADERVFYRKETEKDSLVVGAVNYANYECYVALVRGKGTNYISDTTPKDKRAIAECMQLIDKHYVQEGISHYNIIVEQSPLNKRAYSFRIIFQPAGPGYVKAGVELATGLHTTFVAASPEKTAQLIRNLK